MNWCRLFGHWWREKYPAKQKWLTTGTEIRKCGRCGYMELYWWSGPGADPFFGLRSYEHTRLTEKRFQELKEEMAGSSHNLTETGQT